MHTILLDAVNFKGHTNIRATNNSTLEITKEDFLTPRGDCIVGVSADKSCADLAERTRHYLMSGNTRILIRILVEEEAFDIYAHGDNRLTLINNKSMVVRKSSFICPRTLAIKSSASASDLPRSMIKSLAQGKIGRMEIYALLDNFS